MGCCGSVEGGICVSLGVCSEGRCEGTGILSHLRFTSPLHPPGPDPTDQNGTDHTSRMTDQVRI